MKPIFFGWTRSFWLSVITVLLIVEQTGQPAAEAIGTLFGVVFGVNPEQSAQIATTMLPIVSIVLAIHQRSGAARPYTAKINKETLT